MPISQGFDTVPDVVYPSVFLQADLGFYIAREGWDKLITSDGSGGYVCTDGSLYVPADDDLEATDWSVK
jgi:hypothetical protein